MVLQATGANWLTLMMRAERSRDIQAGGRGSEDDGWLLNDPTDLDLDLDVVEDEGQGQLLAAE